MPAKNFKRDDIEPLSEIWKENGANPEAERLWAEEAEHRYQEFLEGKVEAAPGEEALKRIRAALR